METREDFGRFVRPFFKTGSGAEVGTRFGLFAEQVALYWPGRIICVDLWTDEECFEVAQRILRAKNFHMYRGDSIDIARGLSDGQLDWVYIDADHSYRSVQQDLHAWWPKLREGGLFAGHDYAEFRGFGVKRAVDEFAAQVDRKVSVTTKDFWKGQEFPTWWFVK